METSLLLSCGLNMGALFTIFNKVIKNPLLRQSLLSLIARFTGVALNFAVILIITNQLSKSGAGDLMLLMTFITGVALISSLHIYGNFVSACIYGIYHIYIFMVISSRLVFTVFTTFTY